jgi:hypothetical protein
MEKIFVVSWKKGSKSGNGYVKAKDIVEAQQKAIDNLWLCLDDIVDIAEYKNETDIKETLSCMDMPVCYATYRPIYCRIF